MSVTVKTSEKIHTMSDGRLFVTVMLDGNKYEPSLGMTAHDAEQFSSAEDFERYCVEAAFKTLDWETVPLDGIGDSRSRKSYSRYKFLHKRICITINGGFESLIGVTKSEILSDLVERPFGTFRLSQIMGDKMSKLVEEANKLEDEVIALPPTPPILLGGRTEQDRIMEDFIKDMVLYKDPVWLWARSWDQTMALEMVKSYGPATAYEFFKASMELEADTRKISEEREKVAREIEKAAAIDLEAGVTSEPQVLQQEPQVGKSNLFKGYAEKYIEYKSMRIVEGILQDTYLANHCSMNKIRLATSVANNKVDDVMNSIDFVKAVEEDLQGKLDVVRNQAEFNEAVTARREALRCSLLSQVADMMAAANKTMSAGAGDLIPSEVMLAVMTSAGNDPVGLISPVVKEATEKEMLDVLVNYPGLSILKPVIDKLLAAKLRPKIKAQDSTNIGAMSDVQILTVNVKISGDDGFIQEKEFDLMVTNHPHDPSKPPVVTWKPTYKKIKGKLVKVGKNQSFNLLSDIEELTKFLGI